MARVATDQRPLFPGWHPWEDFPEPVREQALDLLVALYLESIKISPQEPNSDDTDNH